jgi:hypothetical protein
LEEAVKGIQQVVDKMRAMEDLYDGVKQLAEAKIAFAELDIVPIDELKEEIGDWKSNLEGTNFEQGEKFALLEECYDNLDSLTSALEAVNEPSSIDDIEEVCEEIENAISEAESIDFPGMY